MDSQISGGRLGAGGGWGKPGQSHVSSALGICTLLGKYGALDGLEHMGGDSLHLPLDVEMETSSLSPCIKEKPVPGTAHALDLSLIYSPSWLLLTRNLKRYVSTCSPSLLPLCYVCEWMVCQNCFQSKMFRLGYSYILEAGRILSIHILSMAASRVTKSINVLPLSKRLPPQYLNPKTDRFRVSHDCAFRAYW